MEITLNFKPVPLQRPRYSQGRVYDSQKDTKLIQWLEVKKQYGNQQLHTDALHLDIVYVFPLAKSHAKAKYQALIGKPHTAKGDIDNYLKFTMDLVHGIVYNDDAVVASINAKKIWGVEGKTVFSFKKI